MEKRTNKRLTIKYWNSLSEGTKKRALQASYPTMPSVVDMLLREKPNMEEFLWQRVFKLVKVTGDDYWKICVNGVYYQ